MVGGVPTIVPVPVLCGTTRIEVAVRVQKMGRKHSAGLSSSEIDAIQRYEARGRLPQTPPRFWIGGEWVEMSPPLEAHSVVHAGVVEAMRPAAAPTQVPIKLPHAPDPPPAVIEAVAALGAVREPQLPIRQEAVDASEAVLESQLPIYEWVSADAEHSSTVPGWPRSLLPEFRYTTAAEPRKLASQFLPLSRDDGAEPA